MQLSGTRIEHGPRSPPPTHNKGKWKGEALSCPSRPTWWEDNPRLLSKETNELSDEPLISISKLHPISRLVSHNTSHKGLLPIEGSAHSRISSAMPRACNRNLLKIANLRRFTPYLEARQYSRILAKPTIFWMDA